LNPLDITFINGHVEIKELIGKLAQIKIALINTVPGMEHPVFIHAGMASTGGPVIMQLNPVIGDLGVSYTCVTEEYQNILLLDAHIQVHLSEEQFNVIIAIGDIGVNIDVPGDGTQGHAHPTPPLEGTNGTSGEVMPPKINYSMIRLVRVHPDRNEITLKNFGETTVNVGPLTISSEFIDRLLIGTLPLLEGDWILESDDEVKFSWLIDDSADLALYQPTPDYNNPDDLIDFVEWKTAGNGREPIAVLKGIWGLGDRLLGNPPYEYDGDGTQQGVDYWDDF
ncbi:MAG: hypothetical protein ACC656_15315, partial [Candidatus Heimdallarchaeota archaeon]